MKKITKIVKSKVSHIIATTFIGVLMLVNSFSYQSNSRWGAGGDKNGYISIDEPFAFALGVAFLVASFLLYRLWRIEISQE